MAVVQFPGFDGGPFAGLQKIKFKNVNAGQVPAFGIMRITDMTVDAEESYLLCDQPNTYGAQLTSHAINGPVPVDSGSYGYCYPSFGMAPALYDSDDGTPAYNQRWGPQNGTWKLKLNTGGYRTRKAPDSTNFTVIISPDPFVWFRGTANADISSHAAGTASIYYRADATNYTDTTADTPSGSVFNGLDDTVTSGSWVICNWDTYVTGGNVVEGWIIIQSDFAC